ncbi:MAG: UDP-galactopyranose mutase, partial [Lachnospiraceae bacterium]|nr:UDP-galactopyranose mutase [Lachnospiraceae bacterium]
DPYQGIPKGGYTAMTAKLLEGIEVRLETAFEDYVRRDEKNDTYVTNDGQHTFEKVLYTGMIDAFFNYCEGALEYRSLDFETELLEGEENYQGNAVVNYTEREVPYTRIIEHKHFEFGCQPDTVITREYPREWRRGDEPYYPVNDAQNAALYQKYALLASRQQNVLFGGRLGQYRYYDMDKVIAAALEMAAVEPA